MKARIGRPRTISALAFACLALLSLGSLVPPATQAAGAPTAGPVGNTPLGPGEVGLGIYANPHGSSVTRCAFEYGPTASYGFEARCEPKPPANSSADLVKGKLTGLAPGADYHVAFVIATAGGEVTTEDATLVAPVAEEARSCANQGRREEQHATFLPDCRAYELVSPPDKNGGNVIADSQRTHAAVDGNAVAFEALSAFGDATGTNVATEYLAERSSSPEPGGNGWATHGITPLHEPDTGATYAETGQSTYQGEFSPDLNRAIFQDLTPHTPDPSVAATYNLYRREDVLQPGPGHFTLLSSCPRCLEPGGEPLSPALVVPNPPLLNPILASSSPDLSHVLFESMQRRLTADTPESPGCDLASGEAFYASHALCRVHVFETDGSTLRLAGRVPADPQTETSCNDATGPACVPADVSEAGQGTGLSRNESNNPTPDTISDGSDGHTRVFFTQPANASGETAEQIATPSEREAVDRSERGRLFMRVDGTETIQIDASEREPNTSFAPSLFLDASSDGQRAFFLSPAPLTKDSPTDGQPKLYMYSAAPDGQGHHLTLISKDAEPSDGGAVEGFVGVSADGSYVYFTASGQLAAGQPSLGPIRGLYLWHDGSLTYISRAPTGPALSDIKLNGVNWGLALPQARVSRSGHFLLFSTNSGEGVLSSHGGTDYRQTGGCESTLGNTCRELYLYDAATNTLSCPSCDPGGGPPPPLAEAQMATTSVWQFGGAASTTYHRNRAVSADGRYVFFSTAEALVPGDTNGQSDTYEYDTATATMHLLSSGTDHQPSYFLEASPDGRDAFFVTAQPLLGWDSDTSYDLYDARIEGGFPEPVPVTAPCSGDSCRPPAPTPPPASAAASASFNGPANPHRRNSCRHGRRQVTRHGRKRCVPRKHHPHRHHHRRATAHSGATS